MKDVLIIIIGTKTLTNYKGRSLKLKKSIIFTCLLLFLLILVGCSSENLSKVISKEQVGAISDTGIRDKSQWQRYENSRFGYSVNFPKTWYKGQSTQNNDGIVLHVGDSSSFDVRVYGANYVEGVSQPYKNAEENDLKREEIVLNLGKTAVLMTGNVDDMSVYEMIYVEDRFEYHFYAKVSQEYAQEYEDVIIDVIKTFNPSIVGTEKEPSKSENLEKIIQERSDRVIDLISNSNMSELADYVHPEKGVRFTPYTYVSLKNDLVFKKNQIADFMENTNNYLWGFYDRSGLEINLTPEEYWKEFVYDKDFKNSTQKSYNEIIGKSLVKENQFLIYENAIIVEYYIDGSNPELEGIDWKSLRLVFEEYNDEWYLVGIIHNEYVI